MKIFRAKLQISCSLFLSFLLILLYSNSIVNSISISKNYFHSTTIKKTKNKSQSQESTQEPSIASQLCTGGRFLNVLINIGDICQDVFRKKCDVEIKLNPDYTVDKTAVMKILEEKKKQIKGQEVIPACDKHKLDMIEIAKKKIQEGKTLNERDKVYLGLQDNIRNINVDNTLYCAEGRYINKRYCCQFKESNPAEWFLEMQATKLIGAKKQ